MMVQLVAPVVPRETVEVIQPVVRALVNAMDADLVAHLLEHGWEPEQAALGHLLRLLVDAGGEVEVAGTRYRLQLHEAVQPCPVSPDGTHAWEHVGLFDSWQPAYSVCQCGARCDHASVVAVESAEGKVGGQCEDCGHSWSWG